MLDQTYTYQVDRITTVLPKDLSQLNIESGKDYSTLVTCTPYGVNTHRLLVRGHRIPNPKTADNTDYDARIRLMSAVIITSIALVITAIIWWLVTIMRGYFTERNGPVAGKNAMADKVNGGQHRHAGKRRE